MDPITTDVMVICILGGLVFIFIAIVGGGFSIKEITIPKLPKWMRVISFFVGLGLVFISIFSAEKPEDESTTSSIFVSSNPSGGKIYLDGIFKGITPMEIEKVELGSHVIAIELIGYEEWTQIVSVVDKKIYVPADLKSRTTPTQTMTPTPTPPIYPSPTPTPTTGFISVSSIPSRADIYLDGIYKGKTPMIIEEVEEGTYTITLKRTGCQDSSQTISVRGGDTTNVSRFLTFLPTPTSSKIPLLISPINDTVMDNGRSDFRDYTTWNFDWSDVEGATQYQLYAKGNSAQFPLINITINTSSYTWKTTGYITECAIGCCECISHWTWKVRSKVNSQWSEWSEVRNYQVELYNTDPISI